jgi:hypothetical protein
MYLFLPWPILQGIRVLAWISNKDENLVMDVKMTPTFGLPPSLLFMLLVFHSILLMIGVVGNLLTLMVLPYLRRKYLWNLVHCPTKLHHHPLVTPFLL